MKYSELVSSTNKEFLLAQKIHRFVKSDKFKEFEKHCTEADLDQMAEAINTRDYKQIEYIFDTLRLKYVDCLNMAELRNLAKVYHIHRYNELFKTQLIEEIKRCQNETRH